MMHALSDRLVGEPVPFVPLLVSVQRLVRVIAADEKAPKGHGRLAGLRRLFRANAPDHSKNRLHPRTHAHPRPQYPPIPPASTPSPTPAPTPTPTPIPTPDPTHADEKAPKGHGRLAGLQRLFRANAPDDRKNREERRSRMKWLGMAPADKKEGSELLESINTQTLLKYFEDVLPLDQPNRSEWLRMLEQALEMRHVIVIIDGIDEAAGRKEAVGRFLRQGLVQKGMRVMATSRPEGVRVADYNAQFVVLDLDPLTQDQQRVAVEQQLESLPDAVKDFASHLLAFSNIRREHGRIWEAAFESADVRKAVEALQAPDRFRGPEGQGYDPAMRQKCLDGTRVVERQDGELRSAYLQGLDAELSPLLRDIDPEMEGLGAHVKQQCPRHHKVALDLLRLFQKLGGAQKWTARSLWCEIMSSTDEIYEAAERLEPEFRNVLADSLERAGLVVSRESLIFGPLKDPVRVYEKAHDDYVDRFAEGLPTACVADIIRARVVCSNGKGMLKLLESLARQRAPEPSSPQQHTADPPPHLELVRLKNKCAPEQVDPTHFRNVLVNCLLRRGDASVFVEVQVHHEAVLAHNEAQHAHDHYNYFRAKLGAKYQTELDQSLERMLLFFEEIRGVPVLLSMLVLLLRDPEAAEELPADRYQLYEQAMLCAARACEPAEVAQNALSVLRRVALANQVHQRRIFRFADVRKALGRSELTVWKRLEGREGGLPLIKILEVGATDTDALFEFSHLSLQEALCAQALADGMRKFTEQQVLRWWDDAYYENTWRIGGTRIGKVFSGAFGSRDFHLSNKPSAAKALLLCHLLEHNPKIKDLDLRGVPCDAAQPFVRGVAGSGGRRSNRDIPQAS